MTISEISKYFYYHNSNMIHLKIGYEEIRNQIKELYKRKDSIGNYLYKLDEDDNNRVKIERLENALSRILSGIQVSWAEESLKRLLYEPNVFTNVQRNYLLERPALDQKWYKTLHIIFCIAYDLVLTSDENCELVNIEDERSNLGDELVDQYFHLKDIITTHLVPNFSIRNKVQHGEWIAAFQPRFSQVYSQDITDKVNRENIITTTARFTLVNAFYQMLVDLGRFKSNSFALDSMQTPFEYFYKNYMRKINFEIKKINDPNIEAFRLELIFKEIKGLEYRNIN